jgi:hypothetical protein
VQQDCGQKAAIRYFVCPGEQRRRHLEAKSIGGLQVPAVCIALSYPSNTYRKQGQAVDACSVREQSQQTTSILDGWTSAAARK